MRYCDYRAFFVVGSLALSVVVTGWSKIQDKSQNAEWKKQLRVHMAHLVTAVQMYHELQGTFPKSLDELITPLKDKESWPKGGFLIGGKLPKDPWSRDYRYTVNGEFFDIGTLGADGKQGGSGENADRHMSDVLILPKLESLTDKDVRPRKRKINAAWKKQLCIHMAHLGTAVQMYHRLQGAFPKSLDELIVSSKDEKSWSKEEFLIGGELPKDPWGRGYQYTGGGSGDALFLIWTWGADGKQGGSGKDADRFMSHLVAFEVTPEFKDGDAKPKEGEVIAAPKEREVTTALKGLCSALADFRFNDRDGNAINDYWTGDISGLYRIRDELRDEPIKLIDPSLAGADGGPVHIAGRKMMGSLPAEPYQGYWFQVLKVDRSVTPAETYQGHTDPAMGPVHNISRFGLIAYPDRYGVTGKKVFIVNEGHMIFKKDPGEDIATAGLPPKKLKDEYISWPGDPYLAGWEKSD